MTTTKPQYQLDDLARLGGEVFRNRVLPSLQPDGKFVAVDVKTGEHEMDPDDFTAVSRLRARIPSAEIWLERVGQPAAYKMRHAR